MWSPFSSKICFHGAAPKITSSSEPAICTVNHSTETRQQRGQRPPFPLRKPLPRLTDAVRLHAAPRQVGEAGPGGGALQQVSLLALEKDDASHLFP